MLPSLTLTRQLEDTGPITFGAEKGSEDAESVDGMLREIAAAPFVDPDSAPEPGDLIGGSFRIERLLGEGGMGVVYLAHDEELDRKVAVKLQRVDRSERLVQRVAREARAMARVSHPNVVPVHEVGEHRGRVFIAMEYVDGATARDWVLDVRTWEPIVELYVAAGRGLAAAHAIGLVHRDFKPDNVLVGRDGRPRVADFGLARTVAGSAQVVVSHESSEAPPSSGGSRSTGADDPLLNRVTKTGAAVGTAQYMAPEQHGAGDVDARADQFSFCVALYEALAGRRPFSGRTPAKLLHNIHLGRIRAPQEDRKIPPHIVAVLRRGLSADPNERFPSMDALLTRLMRKPRSRWRVVASVSALAIAGGLGAFLTRGDDADPCDAGSRRLEDAWSDTTRAEIQAAVDGLGKAYATDAWERAIAPLSAYANAWRDAYRDACEATHVRQEQPVAMLHKRVACLDQRRVAFVRVVESLRELDEEFALQMHDAVHGLPKLEPCADLGALERRDDLPEDEAAREAIARIEAERAAARGLDPLTSADHMLAEFQRLLAEAEAIGYRPLIGRLRVNLAEALYQLGRTDDDGLPRQAFHDALASGDDELALLAVSVLVRFHAGRGSPEAHTWAQTGRAILGKLDDPVAGLGLMRSEAIAYSLDNRFEESIALFQAMIALLLEHAPHHHNLPITYADLGKTYARSDNVAEGEKYLRKALELTEKELGPHHPAVAEYRSDIGRIRMATADFETAQPLLEGALEVLTEAYGPANAQVARVAFILANLYAEIGEPERAIALLGPAVPVLRDAIGEEHKLAIDAEVTYAQMLAEVGRFAESREILERILGELSGEDADPVDLTWTLIGLTTLEEAEGDCEKAIEASRRALEVMDRTGADLYRGGALEGIADCLLALGRRAEAIATYEQLIEVRQKVGRPPLAIVRARLGLAKVLRGDPGQSERVQALASQALATVESRSDRESVRLADLARSLQH